MGGVVGMNWDPRKRKYYFGHALDPVKMTLVQYGKISRSERVEAFFKLQKMVKDKR